MCKLWRKAWGETIVLLNILKTIEKYYFLYSCASDLLHSQKLVNSGGTIIKRNHVRTHYFKVLALVISYVWKERVNLGGTIITNTKVWKLLRILIFLSSCVGYFFHSGEERVNSWGTIINRKQWETIIL